MLRWSPGAVKATVGVGALGLMVLLMELFDSFGVHLAYPAIFVLAFTPVLVFFFTRDSFGHRWAERAQWSWPCVVAARALLGSEHPSTPGLRAAQRGRDAPVVQAPQRGANQLLNSSAAIPNFRSLSCSVCLAIPSALAVAG